MSLIDCAEVLSITRDASKEDVRKAYRKVRRLTTRSYKVISDRAQQSALASHPDKVPEAEREEAEIKFKAVQEAYDILYDDDKRHLYDTHGMSAFNGSGEPGMGAGPDLDDILEQMFGMGGMGGMGGMPGMGGMGGMPGGARQKPRRTPNEEQKYEVSLEDLYKGKTVRFASTKNVLCSLCHGKGGKERATAKKCGTCDGHGMLLYW